MKKLLYVFDKCDKENCDYDDDFIVGLNSKSENTFNLKIFSIKLVNKLGKWQCKH